MRQLEEWLAVALENFRLHQEALISRIPKLVRGVTMAEFADKYNGDIQACLRGLQSERVGGAEFEIDRDTRKRKWAAAQEEAEASGSGQAQGQLHEADQGRAPKNGESPYPYPAPIPARLTNLLSAHDDRHAKKGRCWAIQHFAHICCQPHARGAPNDDAPTYPQTVPKSYKVE